MSTATLPAPARSPAAPPGAASSRVEPPARTRLESIDFLRGLIMVLMALDHVRDHLHVSALAFEPTDLTRTTPALFMTRWITHFCAPVFVFLAGSGAFFSGRRRSIDDLSRFLLTRGLWLVLLELTIIGWEWTFNIGVHNLNAQVIWALGWSMVAMSALIRLPLAAIGALGCWMVLGHNLFDRVTPEQLGWLGPLWRILHVPGPIALAPGYSLFVMYPLVPWIGVMAAGYAFGSWMIREDPKRTRRMVALGLFLIAMFAELRFYNFYGDPHPWSAQKNAVFSTLSFLNCEKYPPSLLFLLMTLGPALVVLALVDRGAPRVLKPIAVFGRVPLFYYIVHLLLIDLLTVAFAIAKYRERTPEVMAGAGAGGLPPDWGWGLPTIYITWIAVVLALYPVCRWYAGLKARSRSPLLSYL